MKIESKQRAARARWESNPWRSPVQKEDLVRLYEEENKTQREVAAMIGVSLKRIQTAMRKFNIQARTAAKRLGVHSANECYAWNGGSSISSGGYVLKNAPGHPRATKRGAYVFEHILEMERHINRLLVVGEVVHHINGVKTDNRIENLELTTPKDHIEHHRNAADGRTFCHGAA